MDEKEINWEQRRYEIAKECVATLMKTQMTLYDAASISIKQADFTNMPYEDESFSMVVF